MGEVKWIKINVDMFDDEKIKIIQSMPEGDALLVVWIKLITLAGKTNDGGYIYIAENMPYTDEMLTVIMNKPLNIIRLALDTFNKLGMVENDVKGIYLVNFEKHQSLDKLAEIREKNRLRVKKFREKQKLLECNVTETLCNALDIDKEKDIDKDNIINTPAKAEAIPIKEIIDYMNNCGEINDYFKIKKKFNFKSGASSNKKIIKARINEGYTLEDFKDVIFNAYDKFIEHEYKGLNGKSSIQYYNPNTIFTSSKMEKYKNEYENL